MPASHDTIGPLTPSDDAPTSTLDARAPRYCPTCDYDRAGLDPGAPCPECNAPAPIVLPADAQPSWRDVLILAMRSPRSLILEAAVLRGRGYWIPLNACLAAFLFSASYTIFYGLFVFALGWRMGSPGEAILLAPLGTIGALIYAALQTPFLALPYVLGLFIFGHTLRAALQFLLHARNPSWVRPAVTAATFAPVGWAVLSWAVLVLTTAAIITILACGGTQTLELRCFIAGGALMVLTAGAATLHGLVLLGGVLWKPADTHVFVASRSTQ